MKLQSGDFPHVPYEVAQTFDQEIACAIDGNLFGPKNNDCQENKFADTQVDTYPALDFETGDLNAHHRRRLQPHLQDSIFNLRAFV